MPAPSALGGRSRAAATVGYACAVSESPKAEIEVVRGA